MRWLTYIYQEMLSLWECFWLVGLEFWWWCFFVGFSVRVFLFLFVLHSFVCLLACGFFLRLPPSLCQSGLGFLSIQHYFFSFSSPSYLFFQSLLSSSWILLSVSVIVSECLFKPAWTSVTLPFIVIPWKRLASKLPLMLAQTVILLCLPISHCFTLFAAQRWASGTSWDPSASL